MPALHYLMTSTDRLSPRMISTEGVRRHGRGLDAAASGRACGGGAVRGAGPAARRLAAHQAGGADAGRVGRTLVERVAQRELDLAFGARQRQALGLFGVDEQRHDGDLHRLVLVLVLLDARAGVSTCTFDSTTFEVVSERDSVGLAVATTSTRLPGRTTRSAPQ